MREMKAGLTPSSCRRQRAWKASSFRSFRFEIAPQRTSTLSRDHKFSYNPFGWLHLNGLRLFTKHIKIIRLDRCCRPSSHLKRCRTLYVCRIFTLAVTSANLKACKMHPVFLHSVCTAALQRSAFLREAYQFPKFPSLPSPIVALQRLQKVIRF